MDNILKILDYLISENEENDIFERVPLELELPDYYVPARSQDIEDKSSIIIIDI